MYPLLRPLFLSLIGCLSLAATQVTLAEPHVVVSFDDRNIASWYENRDIFSRYNAKATFVISGPGEFSNNELLQLQTLAGQGHEIGSHSIDHRPASTYCPGGQSRCVGISEKERAMAYYNEQIAPQLNGFSRAGFPITTFAYPHGNYTPELSALVTKNLRWARATGRPAQFSCAMKQVGAMSIDRTRNPSRADLLRALDEIRGTDLSLSLYGHRICSTNTPAGVHCVERNLLDWLFTEVRNRGITVTPFKDVCGQRTPPPLPTATPPANSMQPSIVSLDLVDPQTNRIIGSVKEGMTLDLAALNLSSSGVILEARVSSARSVLFSVNSASLTRLENKVPFTLGGDFRGKALPWRPANGKYQISVTPFERMYQQGIKGEVRQVTFTVQGSSVKPISLSSRAARCELLPVVASSDRYTFKGKSTVGSASNKTPVEFFIREGDGSWRSWGKRIPNRFGEASVSYNRNRTYSSIVGFEPINKACRAEIEWEPVP